MIKLCFVVSQVIFAYAYLLRIIYTRKWKKEYA